MMLMEPLKMKIMNLEQNYLKDLNQKERLQVVELLLMEKVKKKSEKEKFLRMQIKKITSTPKNTKKEKKD